MLTCVEEGLQILTLTIEDLKVTKVQTAMLEYLSLRFSITNHINNDLESALLMLKCQFLNVFIM